MKKPAKGQGAAPSKPSPSTLSTSPPQSSAVSCSSSSSSSTCILELIRSIDDLREPVSQDCLHFEVLVFSFQLAHLLVQNFNVFRLNFYNYNVSVLGLSTLLLAKGVAMEILRLMRMENPFEPSFAQTVTVGMLMTVTVCNLLYLVFQVFLRHSFRSFMYLLYPVPLSLATLFDGSSTHQRTVFRHEKLYYDSQVCFLVIGFMFVGTLMLRLYRLLSWQFSVPNPVGYWMLCPQDISKEQPVSEWKDGVLYEDGAVVLYKGSHWRRKRRGRNLDAPGWLSTAVSLAFFEKPTHVDTALAAVQTAVILSQLLLVLYFRSWTGFMVLLLFNYALFYSCMDSRRKTLQSLRC